MTTTNNRILKIFKSRKTITQILGEELSYNVDDYSNFSINEIDAMYSNNQLDMLLENNENQKVYVKYYFSSNTIRTQNIDDIIDDLFTVDNVLTKKDTLIIIVDKEPNETILNRLKYLYEHDGIFIVVHFIDRLQFNILNHKLVPNMTVLKPKDIEPLLKKYNLMDKSKLPEISRFDPQAQALCVRPGDICWFRRNSLTSLTMNYYRICI
jgi:DNA-directed RNA polymerase subunit H (RpoH/RPB5)